MNLNLADIDRLEFAKRDGLLPAVVQDADRGTVLMVAFMNREALMETFRRRRVVFFSRTRQRLWEKGETSGNHLEFVAASADCDLDSLLISARPSGPVCHLGTATCFGDPGRAYGDRLDFIDTLERVIEQRMADRPHGSYTARLVSEGGKRIAQKVGEEGLEVAIAGASESDERLIAESADLLYHLIVLLKSRGLAISRVVDELSSRHTKG